MTKLEDIKAGIKSEKEGPTETLVRPVEGCEAICPGTLMKSGIDITRLMTWTWALSSMPRNRSASGPMWWPMGRTAKVSLPWTGR